MGFHWVLRLTRRWRWAEFGLSLACAKEDMQLLGEKTQGGSRHFLLLSVGKVSPLRMLWRVFTLRGAYPTAYVPSLAESWIEFRFRGHQFSINDQFGDYWFFVEDPQCPDAVLEAVAQHFAP